jgi:hypothetical protein
MLPTEIIYENFARHVMNAVRANVANADLFSEQDVYDIYEYVEDALTQVDLKHIKIGPEAYAARLLQSSAMIVSYRPGWRERH